MIDASVRIAERNILSKALHLDGAHKLAGLLRPGVHAVSPGGREVRPVAVDLQRGICSGCFLPLLLSAGIIGDDIASGRIRVLVAKPFWPGELYVCRLIGLSLQATVHLVLVFLLLLILESLTGGGGIENLGLWLIATWLLFNVWAALSTSVSVVVERGYNSLFLFVALVFVLLTVDLLRLHTSQYHNAGAKMILDVLKYTCPPFVLLNKFATGEYVLFQSAATIAHSLLLTLIYAVFGLFVLHRRQFPSARV